MNRTSTLLSRFSIACLALLPLLVCLNPLAADEPASGDAYAAFVRESTSSAKNAASERLRRVEEAKAAFRDNGQQPRPDEGGNQVGRQAGGQERRQADSRETTRAALLAVYDANGNGLLDADEFARIRNDRILASKPSSPSVVRWKQMQEQITANKKLSEEEKSRILESIRVRIVEEEKKNKDRRDK